MPTFLEMHGDLPTTRLRAPMSASATTFEIPFGDDAVLRVGLGFPYYVSVGGEIVRAVNLHFVNRPTVYLVGDYSASDTSIAVADTSICDVNDIFELYDTAGNLLEQARVDGIPNATTVVVTRGISGTPAAYRRPRALLRVGPTGSTVTVEVTAPVAAADTVVTVSDSAPLATLLAGGSQVGRLITAHGTEVEQLTVTSIVDGTTVAVTRAANPATLTDLVRNDMPLPRVGNSRWNHVMTVERTEAQSHPVRTPVQRQLSSSDFAVLDELRFEPDILLTLVRPPGAGTKFVRYAHIYAPSVHAWAHPQGEMEGVVVAAPIPAGATVMGLMQGESANVVDLEVARVADEFGVPIPVQTTWYATGKAIRDTSLYLGGYEVVLNPAASYAATTEFSIDVNGFLTVAVAGWFSFHWRLLR